MAKTNVWTIPHGAKRVAKVFATKAEAVAAGRVTATRDKVEHLIHNKDGELGERNSYGNDPARFKG
jgi:Uncharacterized protein conserved in bacteria (DUF2188)